MSINPIYGEISPSDFDDLTPEQEKVLFWALMGDMKGAFGEFAEKCAKEKGLEIEGYPDSVIREFDSDFARRALDDLPEINEWYADAEVGGIPLKDFLLRMEAFAEEGLYDGAPSWDVKLHCLKVPEPANPANAEAWNEALGMQGGIEDGVYGWALKSAWQYIDDCTSGEIGFIAEGRNDGHAVLARNGRRLTARCGCFDFAAANWDVLDDVATAIAKMDELMKDGACPIVEWLLADALVVAEDNWNNGDSWNGIEASKEAACPR